MGWVNGCHRVPARRNEIVWKNKEEGMDREDAKRAREREEQKTGWEEAQREPSQRRLAHAGEGGRN